MSSKRTLKPRRLSASRPLRPTSPSSIPRSWRSVTKRATVRMMLALKAPHRPLSAVITTTSTRSPPRSSSSGWASSSLREAMLCSTSSILRAYGRAANIASCARRSLAADTIFIALVICCVLLTLRIRRRMSIRAGMLLGSRARSGLGRLVERAERGESGLQLLAELALQVLLLGDRLHHWRLAAREPGQELLLVAAAFGDRQRVEEAVRRREDHRDLLLDRQRLVLVLLQDLGHALAAVQERLRRLVEVRGEHREGGHLAVLREVEAQAAGDALHRFHLRGAADARDRVADVDRRADAGVEQVRLEEDLTVGDRDDVGRDVGRQVAGLGLDDRQRGERAAALRVGELRRALEQARVEIEDVAGIRLAAGRAAEQQRDLAIRRRVLGEIVVDDQRVLAVVEEVLAHRAAGVRRQVLQRRRFRGRGVDDDGEVHRAVLLEGLHDLRDGRLLLTDRDVHADDVLPLLIDDRVDRDRGFAGLAVADDELA